MKKNVKKVLIIGAGISGLTAGSYLQRAGYHTEIYEAHNLPGGLCTSWQRKDYLFDGCIHSTLAPSEKYKLNQWFGELIDFNQIQYHYFEELSRIRFENGQEFVFYTDPDKLLQELLKIAPEDETFIHSLIKSVKAFAKYDLQMAKPIELWNPLDYYLRQFITAPYIRHLTRWSKSLKETLCQCNNLYLKQIINQDFFTRYPVYFFLLSLGQLYNKSAGYPIGGSLNIARQLENTYIRLGGKIHYQSPVEKILIENNKARGIVLNNGATKVDTDLVISAADGYTTIFKLLEGKYTDKKIRKRYEEHPKWPSVILVSLGVARSFSDTPSLIDLRLEKPLEIDPQTQTDMAPVTIYNFDPTLAPSGKTCLRVILHTHNYGYWSELRTNQHDTYIREKDRIGNAMVEILDQNLGNIKNKLEVMDVATPATFERYTHNWQGSIQGWEWLPGLIPELFSKTLPGLKNFYMTGQWVMPGGGVAGAFLNARDLVRIICAKDGVKFTVKN